MPPLHHPWTLSVEEAVALQSALASRVETQDRLGPVRRIAGVDVAYDEAARRVYAAVVVLDPDTLQVLERVSATLPETFPYVPGLFSFRELPSVLQAFERLSAPVDLVVCDGQGRAHPARFGLACHLGLVLDLPTIGCAKTRLLGTHRTPGQERGRYAKLLDEGELIGSVLRTQDGVRPVYVSVGHRVSLATARRWVLALARDHRLPETTRAADAEANRLRAQGKL